MRRGRHHDDTSCLCGSFQEGDLPASCGWAAGERLCDTGPENALEARRRKVNEPADRVPERPPDLAAPLEVREFLERVLEEISEAGGVTGYQFHHWERKVSRRTRRGDQSHAGHRTG